MGRRGGCIARSMVFVQPSLSTLSVPPSSAYLIYEAECRLAFGVVRPGEMAPGAGASSACPGEWVFSEGS